MDARKTVSAKTPWRYEELPPAVLIESLQPDRAAIDQDEFSRAEWFWNRRPEMLCGSLAFVFCYLAVFVCLLCLVPDTILLLFGWIVAGAIGGFVEGVCLERWRNDYEASITRIIVRSSERK